MSAAHRRSDAQRTFAIGDIHGCDSCFERLLAQIDFDVTCDRLWIVGDIVNRGPASLQTLRRIIELDQTLGDRAVTVLGNHDLHLLAVAAGIRKSSSKDTLDSILIAPDHETLLRWLRRRPLLHHDEQLGFTMVHAGLHPHWTLEQAQQQAQQLEMALRSADWVATLRTIFSHQPLSWTPDLTLDQQLALAASCFTRMRYCDLQGKLDFSHNGTRDTAPAHVLPWYQVPDRCNTELNIVFGHWAAHGESSTAGIYPTDFGCAWGGRLRALELETRTITDVDCR